jgi:hypothetical protein
MQSHQSTIGIETTRKTGSLKRLVLLRDGQKDFYAPAIILLANSYSHDTEEGAAYEETQEQRRSGGREAIQVKEETG